MDFIIAFIVLMGMMAWHRVVPTAAVLWLPALILLTMVATFAMGLWLSALNALYRDLVHAVPFMIQIGFFISSVIYETREIVPERWWPLVGINPDGDRDRWLSLGAARAHPRRRSPSSCPA